ncbi:MAG: S8 family peptidase [Halobacteriovoraceae bacterium]|nr:S8 family peptidase [Halobacteriovoraceae bacterium]
MRENAKEWLRLVLCLGLLSISTPAISELPPRIIIKYKDAGSAATKSASPLKTGFGPNTEIVTVHPTSVLNAEQIITKLKDDPTVEYAEIDRVFTANFEPGDGATTEDPQYSNQWHYGAINMPDAWDESLGSTNTVVAVIDTGYTDHSEFSGKILPGFDFVSDPVMGNDGNGYDNDAHDAGDFISFGDPCFNGSTHNSSWHGTHVAGTILANTGNGVGVAGINWNAKLLPVRVLGKCGGYLSDIANGIRWAAGGGVSGVPSNPNPANVINLSLGGSGACGSTLQSAIDFANSQGTVVVVAAGNSNQNIDIFATSPANCNGVITVGASNSSSNKASYSNYGQWIDVSAPGGEQSTGVLSTHNNGAQALGSESYTSMAGTSMAAPHVAGVASLMLGLNPGLFPAQVRLILRDTAQSFGFGSTCAVFGTCGSGIIDAAQAVLTAQVTVPDASVTVPEIPAPSSGIAPQQPNNPGISGDDSSGGCGSVTYANGGGGGPGGPMASLFLGVFLMLLSSKIKQWNISL